MQRPIKKAIFPVAGLGTRFLPATKAIPKEMLPVVDRPLIQMAVDEARAAGIEHMIFVTGRNKGVIEDYFDKQFELEETLRQRGKSLELDVLEQDLPGAGQTSFTRQQEALGLGHAIWCTRHLVGDEPFAVMLPDMVMKADPGCLAQMIAVYDAVGGGNILAVEEAPADQLHRYGVVEPANWQGNQFAIQTMVEKPTSGTAPSNLIISGRYILQPEIFNCIETTSPGSGGEIQITDAMIRLMAKQPFHGLVYQGQTFDCGDKLGFLAANIAYALDRPDMNEPLRRVLAEVVAAKGGQLQWHEPVPEPSSTAEFTELPLFQVAETVEKTMAHESPRTLSDIIAQLRQISEEETSNAA